MDSQMLNVRCILGWTLASLAMIPLLACTSMRSVPMPPAELAAKIRQGHVLRVGDEVTIATRGGHENRFTVTAIDESTVRGDRQSIPIDDIVALKTKQISLGDTALLTGAITLSVAFWVSLFFLAALWGS